jgi:tetratricopeptide (TPR) repeat protein
MSDFSLAERFPEMRPVHRAPSLTTVNGIGTSLAGRRDYDEETNTYVTTLCFCVLFVPVIPLAAYRVAEAGGGRYYFLGRVPLSLFAWRWNVGWPIFAAVGLGWLGWFLYTDSADYKAGRKLTEAHRLVEQGEAGRAAHIYEEVIRGGGRRGAEARTKLDGLIASPPESLSETADVFQVAIDMQRRGQGQVPNLFDRALELAQKNEESDPGGALAVLEVVATLDPRPADRVALHRRLLKRAVAKEPDDPALASRLAVLCESVGDRKGAEAALKRHEGRLGSLDGAAVLGRIHASQGKYGQAEKLLTAYLDARLPQLRSADQKLRSAIQIGRQRILDGLRQGQAPGFDYARYKSVSQTEQGNMVEQYINASLRSDPGLLIALKDRSAQAPVVSAAMDLGIVRLQRAQTLADPAGRRKELERAEQAFLMVQSEAGQTDEYQLNLGQVYYWLGRHAEGKKLFDEVLKNRQRSVDLLLQIAQRLRAVGDWSGARALCEEAYQHAGEQAVKQRAALVRSLLFTDLDDRIMWLERSAAGNAEVRASLAGARAEKARMDGKDEAAVALLREALAIYSNMPENAVTLNNSALIHFELYELTHDRDHLSRGADKLDRSIALQPSDTIALSNGLAWMMTTACQDVIGAEIDLKVLKRGASYDLLTYLYHDQHGQDKLMARLASQPGYHKAVACAEKLMLLAPRQRDSYSWPLALYSWANNLKGIQGVWQKLKTVEVDREQSNREALDHFNGKSDVKKRAEWKKSLSRQEQVWEAARKSRGTTPAVAAVTLANSRMAGAVYGEAVNADGVVQLAENAVAAAPSAATMQARIQALTFRAHQALAKEVPAYGEMARKTARSLGPALLAYVLAHDGALCDKALANADVKRAQVLWLQQVRAFPRHPSSTAWAFLRSAHPEEAGRIARQLLADELDVLKGRINRVLSPLSASVALDQHFLLLMAEKAAEADVVLAEAAKRGVPIPVSAK